jgi:hypothetical protein
MRVSADDYEPLKASFAWLSGHLLDGQGTMPPEQRPLAMLEDLEGRSMANARKGLGMAVGDIVEMTEGYSPAQLAAIDGQLAGAGLWTLTMVRARFGRAVRAIVKRGAIRSEQDYYALRNAVEALPDDEQAPAWEMLAAFEEKATKGAQ